jgi:hypothetical protein
VRGESEECFLWRWRVGGAVTRACLEVSCGESEGSVFAGCRVVVGVVIRLVGGCWGGLVAVSNGWEFA